jgi:hypothetical protein
MDTTDLLIYGVGFVAAIAALIFWLKGADEGRW